MYHFLIMKSVLILSFFLALAHGHNEESFLKSRLLNRYDKNTKPAGQTKINISVKPMAIDFCPHKQVALKNALLMF